MTMKNLEAPSRRKVSALVDTKIRQNHTNLEGMVNEAVEATLMDALKYYLADLEEKTKITKCIFWRRISRSMS